EKKKKKNRLCLADTSLTQFPLCSLRTAPITDQISLNISFTTHQEINDQRHRTNKSMNNTGEKRKLKETVTEHQPGGSYGPLDEDWRCGNVMDLVEFLPVRSCDHYRANLRNRSDNRRPGPACAMASIMSRLPSCRSRNDEVTF